MSNFVVVQESCTDHIAVVHDFDVVCKQWIPGPFFLGRSGPGYEAREHLANRTNFCVQGCHIRGFPLYGVVHSRSASRETCYRKHLHCLCMYPTYSSTEVMAVEEDWLPLVQPQFCTFSPPLDDPPPFFDSHSGTVRCYRSCTYG